MHFNPGWVPYAEREAYLLESDIGVCAHHDHLEARFSFRTRVLDHFWAGLPSVVSGGDSIGELVDRRGLGRAVAPGGRRGLRRCLGDLLDDRGTPRGRRERVAAFAPSLRWSECARPLVDFCLDRGAALAAPAARPWRARRTASTPTCWPTCASAAAWARPARGMLRHLRRAGRHRA